VELPAGVRAVLSCLNRVKQSGDGWIDGDCVIYGMHAVLLPLHQHSRQGSRCLEEWKDNN